MSARAPPTSPSATPGSDRASSPEESPMAAEANAYALNAVSQAAEPFRRVVNYVFGQRPGILTSGSWAVSQSGTPAMSVSVAAGAGLVKGTESANQGAYLCQSLTATTV